MTLQSPKHSSAFGHTPSYSTCSAMKMDINFEKREEITGCIIQENKTGSQEINPNGVLHTTTNIVSPGGGFPCSLGWGAELS